MIPSSEQNQTNGLGWQGLIGSIVAIGCLWMVVLPRLARLAPIQAHIETMEQNHIQVDAMFYTELEWTPPTGAAWRSEEDTGQSKSR